MRSGGLLTVSGAFNFLLCTCRAQDHRADLVGSRNSKSPGESDRSLHVDRQGTLLISARREETCLAAGTVLRNVQGSQILLIRLGFSRHSRKHTPPSNHTHSAETLSSGDFWKSFISIAEP